MSSGRHALPSRFGKLYREIAKFGMVGASGFVVNLVVFNLVRTVTEWQTVRASVLATVVAILSNYLGLRYFAYRNRDQEDRNSRRKELTLFLLFSAIGLVIENSVLYATTYGLGYDGTLATNVSKFLGIGVATLFRFWSYRTWVFRTAGSRRAAGNVPDAVVPYPEPALSGSWERS
ncbi:putative flippase GtrA [Streptomyces sp. SAI-135]|uniref:GtrA family protein n=1 Tax=unclassified Streptomyces TaxID=2593676 RepID=UPI0024736D48|nr:MULTISPECIES: GtrA family protein [unclassified Streptomyces]MDH6517105.1 putative flippase GtrA [Streptomyces sp. SAI-090]MDH6618806.1 putative flippase GtrA [Streptomyces sp. SAI-135]